MRKEVCIPCIYVHGFERCYIMVSHNDYPLWKQGAAEAVILHEVGHAATLTARLASLRPISKLNKVLYLAMVGHLLVMAFAPSESPISFIVLFGLAFCLATVLIGLLITKPLNHSAEYVADSHIVSTAGLTGIQGFLSYFADGLKGGVGGKIISPYAKDTHPAPKDRIAALHLYVRDVLEVRTAS
jgi:Zn-dependent protease with chaperone function